MSNDLIPPASQSVLVSLCDWHLQHPLCHISLSVLLLLFIFYSNLWLSPLCFVYFWLMFCLLFVIRATVLPGPLPPMVLLLPALPPPTVRHTPDPGSILLLLLLTPMVRLGRVERDPRAPTLLLHPANTRDPPPLRGHPQYTTDRPLTPR